jgi:hypothetical protein
VENGTLQDNNQLAHQLFVPRTSARQTTTPTPIIANPRAPRVDAINLFKDSANKLANPTNLHQELNKRMELLKAGENYKFLKNKRYPAAVAVMIDYIIDIIKVKRPIATQAPTSITLASKRYRQFFPEGNLYFEFPREFNE